MSVTKTKHICKVDTHELIVEEWTKLNKTITRLIQKYPVSHGNCVIKKKLFVNEQLKFSYSMIKRFNERTGNYVGLIFNK
jgi:hypothetical protein